MLTNAQAKIKTILIAMVAKLFQESASIKKIVVIYPVIGHSFLPPDRVFERIGKAIRKREVITNPAEYIAVFNEFNTVKRLGPEVPVLD